MLPSILILLASAWLGNTLALPESDPLQVQTRQVDAKYFHEPGVGEVYGHYDVRYYKGQPVGDEEKKDSLRHLIRSYLTVFRSRNIETWIAHGTLLGWWWNGKIMPWDWDLDTQVSAATLLWLGDNMNMTFHNYNFTTSDGKTETREYLLDVNPYITERVRGDGMNVIDARWIDVRNGLFIDITGLAETEPMALPGVWNCKNYHRYSTKDLFPLRETLFEDTPALVPYSFDKILTKEYSPKALINTKHEGHEWIPAQKAWVKQVNIGKRRAVNTEAEPSDNGIVSTEPAAEQGFSNPKLLI